MESSIGNDRGAALATAQFERLLAQGDFPGLRSQFREKSALPPLSDMKGVIERAAQRADVRAIEGLRALGWNAERLARVCPDLAQSLLAAAAEASPEKLAEAYAALLVAGLLPDALGDGALLAPEAIEKLLPLDPDAPHRSPLELAALDLTRRTLESFGLPPETKVFAIERGGELLRYRVVGGRIELVERKPLRAPAERKAAAATLPEPVAHSDLERFRLRDRRLLAHAADPAQAEAATRAALLRFGAGAASVRDAWGRYAVHLAAVRGARGMIGWLLTGGADAGARDNHGHLAQDLAVMAGHRVVARALSDAHARAEQSLLHRASAREARENAKLDAADHRLERQADEAQHRADAEADAREHQEEESASQRGTRM